MRLSNAIKDALDVRFFKRGRAAPLGQAMQQAIQKHWLQRFPGQTHYKTSRVWQQPNRSTVDGIEATAYTDVPGASRAYHPVTIAPVRSKSLAIPISQAAVGHSPNDFNLFKLNGKSVLARALNGQIEAMYALAKIVHQQQDQSIMPSDDELANAVMTRYMKTAFD